MGTVIVLVFLVCFSVVLLFGISFLVTENVKLARKLKATEDTNSRIYLTLKGWKRPILEDVVITEHLTKIVALREAHYLLADELESKSNSEQLIMAHNQLSIKMEKEFIDYLNERPE